ncbi:DUF1990 domain-containing protein [Diaminobutyricimonas sp. TR449]|uniref:DUF1990 family protein n=1 Tax=Diaminobutyricimonas sp. TR449 TaxID=2708076 RepID=UPI0014224396|nr:DUF1990 domain-containing protein [Diaminobutyricimonas sp. TR449]
MRRSTHQASDVTYGAIGATQAEDLLAYPPTGFRPAAFRTRIGHGDARFAAAVVQVRTWQVFTRSDIEVKVDEMAPIDPSSYSPVGWDASGKPVRPAEPVEQEEVEYTADGEQFASPGTTATLTMRVLGIPFRAPVRVVSFIDEPGRQGMALGTRAGHPLSGEESFVVEETADGSVWLDIRLFWRPAAWYWWPAYPALRALQRLYVKRYLRALVAAPETTPDAMPTGPEN